MEKELILEIGTEEIPALFLAGAAADLRSILEGELRDESVGFGEIEVLYTPRRLAARVSGLERKQKDRVSESFGPPVRVAFDEKGNPTAAALGFARSQKVDVEKLVVARRNNGEFLCARRVSRGRKTPSVLRELLPRAIAAIPFRKSMRWGAGKTVFARPVRWIAAVYEGKTVGFAVGDVESSNSSFGHRFTSPKPFRVKSWAKYVEALEKKDVMLDPERRKETVRKRAALAAKRIGGTVDEDPGLLETVVNLVEHPTVLVGGFESKYLRLPEEVLTSVMKTHQKYFPVRSEKTGELLANFVFVCGTPVADGRVVVRGNERVIRARLSDAEFFFSEDAKKDMESRAGDLDSMVFLSGVGSYGVKVGRMKALARELFENPDLERAAELSKSDLATQMVFEFPELQGVMGRHYSLIGGEKKAVAAAVEEQYMPLSRNGDLPRTKTGALLSVVDKIDNISSCFAAGLAPTGSSDPYAVRRNALGIIRICIEKKLDLSLSDAFAKSVRLVAGSMDGEKKGNRRPEADVEREIMEFVSGRFRNLMTESGFGGGVVEAVAAAGFDSPLDAYRKTRALGKFAGRRDFAKLATGFKRVFNIAKKRPEAKLSERLLERGEEKELARALASAKEAVAQRISVPGKVPGERDYLACLESLKTLSAPIDGFFDAVMVMDEDERIRNNRLALLGEIKDLFFRMADFSKI